MREFFSAFLGNLFPPRPRRPHLHRLRHQLPRPLLPLLLNPLPPPQSFLLPFLLDSRLEVRESTIRCTVFILSRSLLRAGFIFFFPDPVVDEAAVVLRLQYIADLHDVQSRGNQFISFIQEFTANPIVNPKLGKVGI